MLIITNGSSVVGSISRVCPNARVLCWNDVLHDGPVPDLNLSDLSEVRAAYLEKYAPDVDVLSEFQKRDRTLRQFRDYAEVVLFFEHDLYDQLQLCQLLNFFAGELPNNTTLSLALGDQFLGEQDDAGIATLLERRRPLRLAQLETGASFWSVFTSQDHSGLKILDCSAIPFLPQAKRRLLQEYPSVHNGLGRSRRQILDLIQRGVEGPVQLFRCQEDLEEAKYLGDSSLWSYIVELETARNPLIVCQPESFRLPGQSNSFAEQCLQLTSIGRDVHDQKQDDIDLNGIDLWIGGVHVHSGSVPSGSVPSGSVPRWDDEGAQLVYLA